MPQRTVPDPLAKLVGARIRALRQEQGLTIERLAYESELGSKGHLAGIEKGLVRPNIQTLHVLAERLGCRMLDLVAFPQENERDEIVDLTRHLPAARLRGLLRDLRRRVDPKGGDER
jgi:transcriptional regulator with XRE-family HTH domain